MTRRGKQDIKKAALNFVDCINSCDPDALMRLMTEDFTFIDVSGQVHHGKERWDYFERYPEYQIHIQQILTGGSGVAIIGTTTGSHIPPETEKHETLIWTAEIRGEQVAVWRIYST